MVTISDNFNLYRFKGSINWIHTTLHRAGALRYNKSFAKTLEKQYFLQKGSTNGLWNEPKSVASLLSKFGFFNILWTSVNISCARCWRFFVKHCCTSFDELLFMHLNDGFEFTFQIFKVMNVQLLSNSRFLRWYGAKGKPYPKLPVRTPHSKVRHVLLWLVQVSHNIPGLIARI